MANLTHGTPSTAVVRLKTFMTLLIGGGLAVAGSFLAWAPGSPLKGTSDPIAEPIASNLVNSAAATPLAATNPNFITDVVNQVGPAVVRIDASRTVRQNLPEAFNDPFFRRFFGDQLPAQSEQRVERGLGSGFIISEDGRIITNAHVVDGADMVQVTLKDGRVLDGEVLGSDPVTDIAVIKVAETNLPIVTLSNSDQIQPGEWAIAIGNPLGLDNTVTVGIVSAVGRSSTQVGVPNQRVDFIQTDTAINPGNSGGPLLNQEGQVIGVNSAIINGAQGLGFAIPINTVKRISDQLVATGRVEHPFLGIEMVSLTPQVKAEINSNPNSGLNVESDHGVLVARVLPNSPAAEAGLRSGDVIIEVDAEAITEAVQIQQRVEAGKVGQALQLKVLRNGREQTLAVRPGRLPDQPR